MGQGWTTSLILGLLSSLLFGACGGEHPPLEVVDEVELYRYTGTWYEIERLPNRFERNLKCVTATYTLDEKDRSRITVRNRGINTAKDNKAEDIKGSARVPNPEEPAKLKVTFFWPFAGDYHILALDEAEGEAPYRYALVGDPSRKFLWILARNPDLDPATVERLKSIAQERGFDTSTMEAIAQDC
jgi:lipocalin